MSFRGEKKFMSDSSKMLNFEEMKCDLKKVLILKYFLQESYICDWRRRKMAKVDNSIFEVLMV